MTRLTVEFDWQQVGHISLDDSDRLVFPLLPTTPGLYRFWVKDADERTGVYIGEAADMRRRMQQYRSPGIKQATNRRLNERLKTEIRGGSVATVSIVTDVVLTLDAEEPRELRLDRRTSRLIA